MTETTVSTPFMKELREQLASSVVIKHHDSSMIGLPDCSVNWNSRTAWLEFKLITLKEEGSEIIAQVGNKTKKTIFRILANDFEDHNLHLLCRAVAEASPVQFQLMKKLDIQAWSSYYVIWVRKRSAIFLWNPYEKEGTLVRTFRTNSDLATWLKRRFGDPE